MTLLNYRNIILCLLSGVIIFSGCEKEETQRDSNAIAFGVEGSEMAVSTRSAMSVADLNAGNIYVFGILNNTNNIFSATAITRDGTNGLWYPGTARTWESGTYTFRGVASSEDISSISTSGTVSGTAPTPGILAFNSGLSFQVNQPTTYVESDMIDYLLSHTFNVANGSSRPLVKLQMEHSMPAVEIYVLKSATMYSASIELLKLEGIFSSGTMTCSSPVVYGNTGVNIWSTSLSGGKTSVYSLSGTQGQIPITDLATTTSAKMKIITMPQQLSPDAQLTVKYWVNEKQSAGDPDNYVSYTETFSLYEYSPQNWNAAHRIIYTLKIDTSITLTGVITEWKNVDFIEGTILPSVEDTTSNP